MRALPLLILALLASPAAAQSTGAAVACKEDNTDCKEDCSIEYGSSSRTYSKLSACLKRCQDKYNLCKERHFAIQERKNLGLEDTPAAAAPASPKEPRRSTLSDDSSSDEDPSPSRGSEPAAASKGPTGKNPAATPAARSEPTEPTVRRGVYRASEPEPAPSKAEPKPAPVAAPKPQAPDDTAAEHGAGSKATLPTTAAAKDELLLDDEDIPQPPPPPKPPPKPAFERPVIPPEPKKKDISEWDPNGD
jgi:hypothetical protein